ncbi:cytochrome c oxidase subunit 4 [Devriesea agamarum]|uniref:cytochrome c oxidase subunit 4 n=1 Tax=Devriesea agamarum TaxID=472569 RepID=UPI00071E0F9A|nr:cytochrome c oxidase subunit 4 [Devriesea agamarum]
MKTFSRIFMILTLFFVVMGVIYGLLSKFEEPIGFAAILMLGAMSLMIAAYVGMKNRDYPGRPEDNENAEVSDEAGVQGSFAPYSWWPFWGAIAASLCFTGVAAGWWIFIGGLIVGIIAIVGWVMEFSRGQYAH